MRTNVPTQVLDRKDIEAEIQVQNDRVGNLSNEYALKQVNKANRKELRELRTRSWHENQRLNLLRNRIASTPAADRAEAAILGAKSLPTSPPSPVQPCANSVKGTRVEISKERFEDLYRRDPKRAGDPAFFQHMHGTDFSKPLYETTFGPGDCFLIYVRPEKMATIDEVSDPGYYATGPAGVSPQECGIYGPGRTPVVFRVKDGERIASAESTAGPVHKDKKNLQGGPGGGPQFRLPPGWRNSVEVVRKGEPLR